MHNNSSHDIRYIEVQIEENGQRLDNFLIRILKGVPKSHIYRIIRSGEVRINKKRSQAATRVASGDNIRVPPIRTSQNKNIVISETFKQKILQSIIYEDKELIVVNKPSGIAVHGGSGVGLGMIEALRQIKQDLLYLELVHRLDKETSGCLLFAKKRSVLRAIQDLLAKRQVTKTYWALVNNCWSGSPQRVINISLQKNILQSGERMVVCDPNGKKSQTKFKLIENYSQACWLEIYPKTGRTHQIRVHGAVMDHAIIGDMKYGTIQNFLPNLRLYLHAREIKFTLMQKQYCFLAEIDAQFTKAIKELRNNI